MNHQHNLKCILLNVAFSILQFKFFCDELSTHVLHDHRQRNNIHANLGSAYTWATNSRVKHFLWVKIPTITYTSSLRREWRLPDVLRCKLQEAAFQWAKVMLRSLACELASTVTISLTCTKVNRGPWATWATRWKEERKPGGGKRYNTLPLNSFIYEPLVLGKRLKLVLSRNF